MQVHVLIQAYPMVPYRSLADLICPWAVIKGQCHEIFTLGFFQRHRRHILPLVPLVLLIPAATCHRY